MSDVDETLQRLLDAERQAPGPTRVEIDATWRALASRLQGGPDPDDGGEDPNGRGGDGGSDPADEASPGRARPSSDGASPDADASPGRLAEVARELDVANAAPPGTALTPTRILGGSLLAIAAALTLWILSPYGPSARDDAISRSPAQSRPNVQSAALDEEQGPGEDDSASRTTDASPSAPALEETTTTSNALASDMSTPEIDASAASTGGDERTPDHAPRSTRRTAEKPQARDKPLGLAEELALVAEMRAALDAGRDKTVMTLGKQHRRDFAEGALQEERAALETRAACRLGRSDAATRWTSFRGRWPASAHLVRISTDCAKLE